MQGSARTGLTRELIVTTLDGRTRTVGLDHDSITLGRSSANELCYADDAGLSRQHLTIERNGDSWTVRDMGSKNGTMVNGQRLSKPHTLRPRDRVSAGHLTLEFADMSGLAAARTVVFVEGADINPVLSTGTVVTSLEGLISDDGEVLGPGMLDSAPQLRALIRAGRELAGHQPLEELFQVIMQLSIDAVGATRGILMTLEGGELVMQAARGDGFRISTTVRDHVLNGKASMLVRDANLDQALTGKTSIVEQQIRSILAVPLQTNDKVIGLIYLDSPHFVHEFTREDLNLLTVMANVAAIRIEHARLAEVEANERVFAKELEQAAEIQRGLLPAVEPNVAGVELAGFNVACHTVGGDYYDFIPYPDGRVALLVGDVAGKGMPAALLMSSLQARVQVLFEEPTDLSALVMRLNRAISSNCPNNRFITFFIGVLDPKSGEMVYCNAGHNPPILAHRDGTVERLSSGGLIMGILPNAQYEQKTCKLEPGDVVVLFSDGVSEACQPAADIEFGEDRLADIVAEMRGLPAKAILDNLSQRLMAWIGDAPASDDITLVVARRL